MKEKKLVLLFAALLLTACGSYAEAAESRGEIFDLIQGRTLVTPISVEAEPPQSGYAEIAKSTADSLRPTQISRDGVFRIVDNGETQVFFWRVGPDLFWCDNDSGECQSIYWQKNGYYQDPANHFLVVCEESVIFQIYWYTSYEQEE